MRIINADELLNRLNKVIYIGNRYHMNVGELLTVREDIERMSTIETWIPITEEDKLPDLCKMVLVSTIGKYGSYVVTTGFRSNDSISGWVTINVHPDNKVIAWMPLPKPYKEKE